MAELWKNRGLPNLSYVKLASLLWVKNRENQIGKGTTVSPSVYMGVCKSF